MSAATAVILTLANLGKGLFQNPATKLVDVFLSTTDARNMLKFGTDNGLTLSPSSDPNNGITLGSDGKPFVTAANQIPATLGVFNGAILQVVNGQATWVNLQGGPIPAWPAQGLM